MKILGKMVVAEPKNDAMTCIKAREVMAPANTIRRGFFIALASIKVVSGVGSGLLRTTTHMMAAMKKVLSPSSETMITDRAAKKPWMKSSSDTRVPFLARTSAGDRETSFSDSLLLSLITSLDSQLTSEEMR